MAESTLQFVGTEQFATPNPDAAVDVVFVHGLGGHPIETWSATNDMTGFWPRWLAEEVPGANIWTAGYDSSIFVSALFGEGSSLSDRATALLDFLASHGLGTRPIVFITHSLGGLIVNQMLRVCSDHGTDKCKRALDQTRAIVFCGTPHAGTAIASIIANILTAIASKHIKQMVFTDEMLHDLSTWFRNWATQSSITILAYHETKKTKGLMIVPKASADPNLPGCVCTSIDTDHIGICKPATHQSQLYLAVKALLEAVISSHPPKMYPEKSVAEIAGSSNLPILPAPPATIPHTASTELATMSTHLTDLLPQNDLPYSVAVSPPLISSETPELLEDFEYFTTEAPHDRRPLAVKLEAGGRTYEIKEAERRKERFAMSLRRHAIQSSSLARYTRLMADVESRFKRHVMPSISKGEDGSKINNLVQTEVIDAVVVSQMTETTDIDSAIVENALYYLTGNCHVRWDAE